MATHHGSERNRCSCTCTRYVGGNRGPVAPCPRRDAGVFRRQRGIVGHHLPDRGQARVPISMGGDSQHLPARRISTVAAGALRCVGCDRAVTSRIAASARPDLI
jgi:hypothetical protein